MKNMIALTGIGYDIHHRLGDSSPLMLGGVHIPSSRGLDGHSDADVLCHAIADALLCRVAGHRLLVSAGRSCLQGHPFPDIVAKAVL